MLCYLLSKVFQVLIIHWKHSSLWHSASDFVDNLNYIFFWQWIHFQIIAWWGRSEVYDFFIKQCYNTPAVDAWFVCPSFCEEKNDRIPR